MSAPADLRMLRDAAVEVASAAAAVILARYRGELDVEEKADGTPVTEVDREAHRVIVDGLGRAAPGIPVLSEEGEIPSPATRREWSRLWIVDPLDGTRGFIGHTGEFAVSIALVEDGRPVVGVIHVPDRGHCYAACAGEGAARRSAGRDWAAIRTRKARAEQLVVATGRSRRNPDIERYVERVGAVEVMRMGSAIKPCLVAQGQVDAYPGFNSTYEWDTAATQCILEEAGGALIDRHGAPLTYNRRDSLRNPRFLAIGDPAHPWLDYLEDDGGRR